VNHKHQTSTSKNYNRQARTLGEYNLIEASGLGPGVFAATVSACSIDGSRVDFTQDTLQGEKTRLRLAELLRPQNLTWLKLEHGTQVVVIDKQTVPSARITGDAALLYLSGSAVAFTTADCVPVVISYSSSQATGDSTASTNNYRSFALTIHAGWRSLAGGIIEQALAVLSTQINSLSTKKNKLENPTSRLASQTNSLLALAKQLPDQAHLLYANMQAWIGPAIDQAHYEVDDKTRDALLTNQSPNTSFEHCFQPNRQGHWLADLPGMVELTLRAYGLSETCIHQARLSTYECSDLHSARRDGQQAGRMATFVTLL
jgi:copper oxidase (laccase) domain-containing protein